MAARRWAAGRADERDAEPSMSYEDFISHNDSGRKRRSKWDVPGADVSNPSGLPGSVRTTAMHSFGDEGDPTSPRVQQILNRLRRSGQSQSSLSSHDVSTADVELMIQRLEQQKQRLLDAAGMLDPNATESRNRPVLSEQAEAVTEATRLFEEQLRHRKSVFEGQMVDSQPRPRMRPPGAPMMRPLPPWLRPGPPHPGFRMFGPPVPGPWHFRPRPHPLMGPRPMMRPYAHPDVRARFPRPNQPGAIAEASGTSTVDEETLARQRIELEQFGKAGKIAKTEYNHAFPERLKIESLEIPKEPVNLQKHLKKSEKYLNEVIDLRFQVLFYVAQFLHPQEVANLTAQAEVLKAGGGEAPVITRTDTKQQSMPSHLQQRFVKSDIKESLMSADLETGKEQPKKKRLGAGDEEVDVSSQR